jgi:hypothetical protein
VIVHGGVCGEGRKAFLENKQKEPISFFECGYCIHDCGFRVYSSALDLKAFFIRLTSIQGTFFGILLRCPCP